MKRLTALLLFALAFLSFAPPARAQAAAPTLPYIYYGGYGTFQFSLSLNSAPYVPSGTYSEKVSWTVSDTAASITWNDATTLATVSVPKTDTATSLTITATCVDPNGTMQTATYIVPLLAQPSAYAATIVQVSAVGP
jgi:cytochrome c553